jgi:hypothetical protein
MIIDCLKKSNLTHLIQLLSEIDQEMSEATRAGKCPWCGGPLHRAPYHRQPDGGSIPLPPQYRIRLSLCCGQEGCRRRVLPPSCLFLGRRVYVACIVLVAVALQQNSIRTAQQVETVLGVPVRTLRRWMSWFRNEYLKTRQWLLRQGFIVTSSAPGRVIGELLDRFMVGATDPHQGLVNFIRFMTVDPKV